MRDYGTARRNLFAPSDAVRSITLPRRSAIKCNALNLSRYWKTGLSAESQPPSTVAVGWGLDCLPANGSLSRAATMPHSAVRGDVPQELIDRECSLVAAAHHFSESFGIKDFFRDRSDKQVAMATEKSLYEAPNAY